MKNEALSYLDPIQLDGAFSTTHTNYGNSPVFNGIDAKALATKSRKDSLSSAERVEDVLGNLRVFNGTEKVYSKVDREEIWKAYWSEYINAFNVLEKTLPDSVVTAYIGRQAIEIGLKYLLLIKQGKIIRNHDLGELCEMLYSVYDIKEEYMKDIDRFCAEYCEYIEGGNPEYFRYPEYKGSTFFAGNQLSTSWISYNFKLIILKLMHFAGIPGADITDRPVSYQKS